MDEIVKHINDTNASYRRLGSGDAKNTDLFLDNEHYAFFEDSGEQITVRFEKENLQKAILFIASILPRKYDNSAIHTTVYLSENFVTKQLAILNGFFMVDGQPVKYRTQVWNPRKNVPKKNGEIDNRFYFNGLLEDIKYVDSDGNTKVSKFTVRNYLAGGYSDIHIKKNTDGVFDVWITNALTPSYDGKEDDIETISENIQPLQQIFYGAPGTGKSHKINAITKEQPQDNVFRTTFHPDSDYSTFVGCYKPTMQNKIPIYKIGELINKLTEIKSTGVTYPCHKFAAKYWESLKDLSSDDIKNILLSCKFTESMNVEISKGVAIGQDLSNSANNKKIVYSFIPQAFSKAYLRAWQTKEPVYLIIEEINRGNCAQIFGDLFQLLDRKNGVSEYPIKPDTDLGSFIAENMESPVEGAPESVVKGEEMILPSNLYIWATMNTSDQSLFPIDSAFKRRWDWVYIPINENKEEWCVEVEGVNYKWSSFLKIVNKRIYKATSSEDKQLGFYFCKADNNIISAEKFVSKVLFYLWNDVFKDYDEGESIFKATDDEPLTFSMFYNIDGSVNEKKVTGLLESLEIEKIGDDTDLTGEENEVENQSQEELSGGQKMVITFGDGTVISENTYFDTYAKALTFIGLDKSEPIAAQKKYKRKGCALIDTKERQEILNSDFEYVPISGYYLVKGINARTMRNLLNYIAAQIGLELTVEYKPA